MDVSRPFLDVCSQGKNTVGTRLSIVEEQKVRVIRLQFASLLGPFFDHVVPDTILIPDVLEYRATLSGSLPLLDRRSSTHHSNALHYARRVLRQNTQSFGRALRRLRRRMIFQLVISRCITPAANADTGHIESVGVVLVPVIAQCFAHFGHDASVCSGCDQPGI